MGNKKKRKLEKARMMDAMVTFTRACADARIGPKLFDEAPCWLWTSRGDRILWANESGIRFFKTKSLSDLLGRKFRNISPALAEISRIGRSTEPGFQQERSLRYLIGMRSVDVPSRLEHLEIEGVGQAIFVRSLIKMEDNAERSPKKLRSRFIKMCARGDVPSGFLTTSGKLREATEPFQDDIPNRKELDAFIDQLNSEAINFASARINDVTIILGRIANKNPSERELFIATLGDADYESNTTLDAVTESKPNADASLLIDNSNKDKTARTPEPSEEITESAKISSTPEAAIVEEEENIDQENAELREHAEEAEDDAEILGGTEEQLPEEEISDVITEEALEAPNPEPSETEASIPDIPVEPTAPKELKPDDVSWDKDEERFLFELNQTGEFTSVSTEFLSVMGSKTGSIKDQSLFDLIRQFNLDPDNKIEQKFSKKAIWTQTIMWPTSQIGTVGDKDNPPLRVPVGLTAMPVFDRYRNFEGFRGFGVIKLAEASQHQDLEDFKAEITLGEEAADQEDDSTSHDFATDQKSDDDFPSPEDKIDENDRSEAPIQQDNVAHFPGSTQVSEASFSHNEEKTTETIPEKNNLTKPEQRAFEQIALALGNNNRKDDAATDPKGAEGSLPESATSNRDENGTEELAINNNTSSNVTDIDFSAANAIEGTASRSGTPEETPELFQDQQLEPLENEAPVPADAFAEETSQADDNFNDIQAIDQESQILNDLPVGVLVSRNRTILFANKSALTLLGYDNVGALQSSGNLNKLFLPLKNGEPSVDQDHDVLRELVTNADSVDGETPLYQPARLRKADDNALDAMIALQPGIWQNDDALIITINAEQQIIESITNLPSSQSAAVGQSTDIMDIAADGILILDQSGTLRHANTSAEALFGRERDQIKEKPITDLFAEESQQTIRDYLEGLTSNGVASVLNDGREVIGREASGGLIPLFMTIGQIGDFTDKKNTLYCAVVRDITQWKAAEEELVQSRKLAEDANAQKSDFLARISHEIRTPLNAIIGFSEVMMNEHFGPMENQRYLEYARDINISGTLLVSLVNDLLDLSKIEAGKVDLSFSSVSLNTIVQECVALMQPEANRERLIIRTSMTDDLPPVVADPRSIRQIALNLLSNAIKFTDAGGQVIVSTTLESNGEVALRIRDTGIGMTEKDLEHAMQPFRQVAAATRKGQSGTGLGLPLTKALVEANKAQFSINSRPDYGTLIQVLFPNERVLAH